MEQQRAAIEGFSANSRTTNAAVSDVAARMTDISTMVARSSACAINVAEVAVNVQNTSQSLRSSIPDIARKATRADLRDYPRYDIDTRARIEADGRTTEARVFESVNPAPGSKSYRPRGRRARCLEAARVASGRRQGRPFGDDGLGVSFEPQKLKTEARRLIRRRRPRSLERIPRALTDRLVVIAGLDPAIHPSSQKDGSAGQARA